MAPPLPQAMAPLFTVCVSEAEVIDLETMPSVGVPGGEVIDLESAECRSRATMAKSMEIPTWVRPSMALPDAAGCVPAGRRRVRCGSP
uniref:Uncharacterized protein n=1 Tax=Oryza rufipogon TaxID=4529 RepID=A0A0E0QWK4_ORYRU